MSAVAWVGAPGRDREAVTAILTTWLVLLVLTLQLVGSALTQPDSGLSGPQRGLAVALGVGCALSFVVLHARYIGRRRPYHGLLTALVVLFSLALLPLSGWSLVGLGMAAVMLRVPMPWGAVAALGFTAVVGVIVDLGTQDAVVRIVIPVVGVLVGLIIYTLTRLVVVLQELHLAREHVARLQVDDERHRISRDLHDIMGRALVTASLRNQTAIRLVERDPSAALSQLLQAEEILASSQAQLRAITSGPTTVSFESEVTAAAALFERLNVKLQVSHGTQLPEEQTKVAAHVLREAVTNMLKHSRPRNCWIRIREESTESILSIVNDGVLPDAASEEAAPGGTGLLDLARRVELAGGVLEAKHLRGGRFTVLARLPKAAQTGEVAP